MADENLVLSMMGDWGIQHRVSAYKEERFLKLVELLRDADLSMANLEGNIQNGENWPAFIAGQGGFGSPYNNAPPFAVEEIKFLGLKGVFTANNHASDFGEGGIVTTLERLDTAGLLHAGTGRSMTEACFPAFQYTAKGRVAVIGAADNGIRGKGEIPFPTPRGFLAADQGPWFKDRPGVNMIRYEPIFHVDRATFDALKRASKEIGWEEEKEQRRRGAGALNPSVGVNFLDKREDSDTLFHFMGTKFKLSDKFSFETIAYQDDLDRNYKWIKEARRNADIVLVGCHQQGSARVEGESPDHIMAFAHGSIDAGADAFVAHGSSRMCGVEIYKGKPIVYGVPGFLNQISQRRKIPPEQLRRFGLNPEIHTAADFQNLPNFARQEAGPQADRRLAAMFSFVFDAKTKSPMEVRVYPTECPGYTGLYGGSARDVPMLAEPGGESYQRTLQSLAERSKRFGVTLETVKEGHAVIKVR